MKILVIGSFSPSLSNFRGPFITALINAGLEVHVAAPGLLSDVATLSWLQAQGAVCHGISLSRSGLNPIVDLWSLVCLIRLIARIEPDLFLGYTAKPVIWGLISSRLVRVSQRVALITGLGYSFTGSTGALRRVMLLLSSGLYWLAFRSATHVFFQNNDDASEFFRMGLVPRGVPFTVVAGSGVDLAHFSAQPLPVDSSSFLMIARLLVDKGIREYLASALMVRQSFSGVEFHLVGGKDSNPAAIPEMELKAAHEAGIVTWHGHLHDVRPILASVQCYVLPSYREGMPRTVLEAMATGRPIITTDVPGCRDTVIDGVNGFLVEPRNAKALAAAMLRWIQMPLSEKQLMAEASLELVRKRFDVHKVNAQMLSALGL